MSFCMSCMMAFILTKASPCACFAAAAALPMMSASISRNVISASSASICAATARAAASAFSARAVILVAKEVTTAYAAGYSTTISQAFVAIRKNKARTALEYRSGEPTRKLLASSINSRH